MRTRPKLTYPEDREACGGSPYSPMSSAFTDGPQIAKNRRIKYLRESCRSRPIWIAPGIAARYFVTALVVLQQGQKAGRDRTIGTLDLAMQKYFAVYSIVGQRRRAHRTDLVLAGSYRHRLPAEWRARE